MKSTTQRALRWAREQGWRAAVVEVWVGFGGAQRVAPGSGASGTEVRLVRGVRRDFMGFADVLALDSYLGVHALQTFSASRYGDHLRDWRADAEVMAAVEHWLTSGNRLTLLGWRKVKRKGRPTWRARVWGVHWRLGDIVCVEQDEAEEEPLGESGCDAGEAG